MTAMYKQSGITYRAYLDDCHVHYLKRSANPNEVQLINRNIILTVIKEKMKAIDSDIGL